MVSDFAAEKAAGGGADPPPHADAQDASAALATLRFGVFPRLRSLAGADTFPRGLPSRGARPIEQVELSDALTRRWDDDRHIVLYTSNTPYRINNAAIETARVAVQLLAFDVDNHDDAPGWLEAERTKIAALCAAHPGGFAHTTKRGWRMLFALPEAFPVRSEADKHAWVLHYARVAAYVHARFGIALDSALIRWNQPVRLPHVVREGRVFDAEILTGDPRALGVFTLPESEPAKPNLRALAAVVPSWGGVAKQWEPRREKLRVATTAWDGIPLPPYAERLSAAATWAREEAPRAVMGQGGRATARSVAACLLVGFALEREDVATLLAGPYNRRRCAPPWAPAELEELRRIAHAVAATPAHVPGFLLSRDRTGAEAARLTLATAAAARRKVALEEVPSRIMRALEAHRAVAIRATCGAGKTFTVSQWIASSTRDPKGARVFIVVPRHELGRAWVEALARAGETSVAYHASVVHRRDAAGKRICDNKVALQLYARGGDVRRDVCSGCPRRPSCEAFATRPSAGARVHVLPREMIPSLSITADDLVVFDDAAVDLLLWHRLTVPQLRRLSVSDPRLLSGPQGRYVRGLVRALIAGARRADAIASETLGEPAPSAGAFQRLAARAIDGQRTPWMPSDVLAAGGDELAATLRDAGTLREVLRFAGACADGGEVQWSEATRSVHGESAAAKLLRAHAGRLVVLDAAANIEELRTLCPALHVERLDVPDAGDVHRVLAFEPRANRSTLSDAAKRPAVLARWLKAALEPLSARGVHRATIVSYKHVIDELRAHPAVAAWLGEHRARRLRFAHFGGVRGSNRFSKTQAVVTLGDPWLHGDDVVGRAAYLGIEDEPSYRIALAAAELGQVHGRSRSVRRRRRLTHVHVGRLVPEGWCAAVVAPLGGPPERSRCETSRGTFADLVARLGGDLAVAERLGCSRSAVIGWRTGRRALPVDALARVQAMSPPNENASSGEGAAGGRGMDAALCKYRSKDCVHADQGGESASASEEGIPDEPVIRAPEARAPKPLQTIAPPVVPLAASVRSDASAESLSVEDNPPPAPATSLPSSDGADVPHAMHAAKVIALLDALDVGHLGRAPPRGVVGRTAPEGSDERREAGRWRGCG